MTHEEHMFRCLFEKQLSRINVLLNTFLTVKYVNYIKTNILVCKFLHSFFMLATYLVLQEKGKNMIKQIF
jgi:hypothetical protein